MKKGYVQIYTGNGKGKTTATLGLTIRALGHGFTVHIVQFLKGGPTGELTTLEKLDNVSLFRVTDADKYIWNLNAQEKKDMQEKSQHMLQNIRKWFKEDLADIIILDEVMAAIKYEIVSLEDIQALLTIRPDTVEVIMTGRDAPQELIDRADLVSEINDVKHYFDKGVKARKGIEF